MASLFNIYSNVWLFFGTGNLDKNDIHLISKAKGLHGITKTICMDDLCKFWHDKTHDTEYNSEIRMQLIINRRDKLKTIYKTLTTHINTTILCNNSDDLPQVLCIYSLNPLVFECIIGCYLYYLHSVAGMDLATASKTLSSKIAGVSYIMTEDMKQFLYMICNTFTN